MIERYTLPEMGRVWSEAHKYELWARVELLVLEAHARAGTVPAGSVEPVRSAEIPAPEAVAAVEAVTDHDVIAFLTAWADNTTPRSAAAWVHYGMTSSDLLDTALAAGVKQVIGHAGPARYPACLVLAGGVALYLAGDMAFRRTLGIGTQRYRAAAAIAALAAMAVGATVSAAGQIALLTAIVAAALVVERRTSAADTVEA